jgi:hypothetical protein
MALATAISVCAPITVSHASSDLPVATTAPTDISANRRHHHHRHYRHYHYYSHRTLPYEGYRPYPPPRFCYPPYYGDSYGYGPAAPFLSFGGGCGW